MNGWHGRLLRINLTTQTTSIESIDPQVCRDFIGGRGVAMYYISKEVDPTVDALAPENKLVFAAGPLTATPAPTGNRYMVVTKSPLTGALAHSNSGGDFPTWMKRTGFDLFIFEGRAAGPVYVWVDEDRVEVRPAAHVWGEGRPRDDGRPSVRNGRGSASRLHRSRGRESRPDGRDHERQESRRGAFGSRRGDGQ